MYEHFEEVAIDPLESARTRAAAGSKVEPGYRYERPAEVRAHIRLAHRAIAAHIRLAHRAIARATLHFLCTRLTEQCTPVPRGYWAPLGSKVPKPCPASGFCAEPVGFQHVARCHADNAC